MSEISRCSSCSAKIEWVKTASGKKMPLDADTIPNGNINVVDGVAHYVPASSGNRVSHFATCPHAGKHRKK